MRLGNDYRIRQRLAEALVGPQRTDPDPWPMVATFFAGIALGALVGGWLAQTNAQRQVIALTGRARELGAEAVGRARSRFDQDVVLEEADEPRLAPAVQNRKRAKPAPVGTQS